MELTSNASIKPIYILIVVLFAVLIQISITFVELRKSKNKAIRDIIFDTQDTKYIIKKRKIVIGLIFIILSIVIYFINNNYDFTMGLLPVVLVVIGFVMVIPLIIKIVSKILSLILKNRKTSFLASKNVADNKIAVSSATLLFIIISMTTFVYNIAQTISNTYDGFDRVTHYTIRVSNLSGEEESYKYLDDIESNINMANFNRDKEEQIIAIREKHNVSKDKEDNIHVPSETQEAFLDDIANAYRDYTDKEGNEFKLDDLSDVDKWRKQADNFIKHLETYDGVALFSGFTMDYTLNHLAYNDYQREAYKLDLKDDIKDVTDEIKKEQTKKKSKKKPKPKLATQEEIQAYYNDKVKEYYNTSTLPTNKAILDTYGAYTSIETNTLDKINLKIKELNQKRDKTHDKEKLDNIKYELEDLLRKKQEQEDTFKNLNDTIKEKQDNLDKITHEYNEKEEHLSNADKQQYKNLIQTLQVDLIDAKDELNAFNNRGIAFRGNIFNELEYTDDKGKTIATIRNRNGDVLEPKDIPPLSDLFLTLTNDNYYTRLDNYNEFIDKIDVLFPKSKGASYKIANETIKRNLGKNDTCYTCQKIVLNIIVII